MNSNTLNKPATWTKILMLCLMAGWLSGCSQMTGIGWLTERSAFCSAYRTLYPSRNDTLNTQRQVLRHNTQFQRDCGSRGH